MQQAVTYGTDAVEAKAETYHIMMVFGETLDTC
jgi:hypothetical protein